MWIQLAVSASFEIEICLVFFAKIWNQNKMKQIWFLVEVQLLTASNQWPPTSPGNHLSNIKMNRWKLQNQNKKKQLLLMELLPKQANQIWKALQYFPFWSYSPPFKKVKSQIVFRKFQQTGDQTGHWVWSVGNPSNPSLAAHIEGFPLVLLTSEKVVCASAFFYATPVKHPNCLARTDPTQRDHKSPISWGNSG